MGDNLSKRESPFKTGGFEHIILAWPWLRTKTNFKIDLNSDGIVKETT